jgi:hypothetical protein
MRPAAGPTVQAPSPAGNLPVLGSVPLPPGAVPDPSGAVHTTPPAGHAVPAARPPLTGTPRQRWEAAVAARPLEAPRPLPGPLHALARSITGRPHPPRFTTGPATRHALAATGALGATTGSVIHLAAVPTSAPASAAVLAHELAHVRRPVRRPRFLLSGASSLMDDDEQEALATGQGLGRNPVGAGIVDRLPVGAGLGAVGEVATRAARAAVIEATAAMPAFPSGGGLGAPAFPSGGGTGAAFPAETAPGALGQPGGSDVAGPQVSAGAPTAPATGQQPAAEHGVAAVLDADRVVEIVEERLLREIERRGGRWAGVF